LTKIAQHERRVGGRINFSRRRDINERILVARAEFRVPIPQRSAVRQSKLCPATTVSRVSALEAFGAPGCANTPQAGVLVGPRKMKMPPDG